MHISDAKWTEEEATAWLRTYPWACCVAQLELAPCADRVAGALRTMTRMAVGLDAGGAPEDAQFDMAGWPALIAGLID